jgi:uncharacterized membrane protein
VKISKAIPIAVVGLVSGLLSTEANAAGATFTTIDFPNATSTAALSINSDGDIVGRYDAATDGNTHGYLRTRRGRFITLDFPHAKFTVATGINSHDVIVGQYRLSTDPAVARHGFVRSRGTFTTIDFPNAAFTNALAINRHGEIVGRYCTTAPPPCFPQNNQHGFLRSRGGHFSTIDFPGAAGTIAGTNAWAINDRGDIVGGYQGSDGKSHVYLRRHNQFTTIDFPTAVDPNAVDTAPSGLKGGINSGGDIVSYYCNLEPCVVNNNVNLDNDGEHGFLLTDDDAFTRIDVPGSKATLALGINNRRDIVGAYQDAGGKGHGFMRKQ